MIVVEIIALTDSFTLEEANRNITRNAIWPKNCKPYRGMTLFSHTFERVSDQALPDTISLPTART